MAGSRKKRSAKTGLPPGALVHIGVQHSDATRLTLTEYDEQQFTEKQVASPAGTLPASDRRTVTWLHIDGLQNISLLEQLGVTYCLHPLILEDILTTEQRPKIEDQGDYLYIVLKLFQSAPDGGRLIPEQISLVLGHNWLISLAEKPGKFFDSVRDRLRTGKGRLRKAGADYLAHALLDGIVDHYFLILDELGEKIEEVEETLVGRPSPDTLGSIHSLKREMILLRKSVWPLREMIASLSRSGSQLVHDESIIYFRDIHDHAVQVIDTIETYRDMLSGMLDIYLTSISNRMNEIMKVLTIIATFFMPLTFLAGVYGMNFKYMPELEWRWAYFALWGVMALIAAGMLVYFRRKKWL